jgi:hypothetical protein
VCLCVNERFDVGRKAEYWFMGNNHHLRQAKQVVAANMGGLPKMTLKKVVAQTDQKKVSLTRSHKHF